jgi:hypothetical protein
MHLESVLKEMRISQHEGFTDQLYIRLNSSRKWVETATASYDIA